MPAPPVIEPVSRRFVSEGLDLHYLDWGNADAPLLVFVHGIADHARAWDWAARALRDDWHVVVPDLRGHGDSAWSPDGAYLVPYHVLDLIALIETLGRDRLTLVGHSFGGNPASRYAALYPDRVEKLALIDGFGPSPASYAAWAEAGPIDRSRDWTAQRRAIATKVPRPLATLEKAAERLITGNPLLPPDLARHLAEHGTKRLGEGYGWKFDPRVTMFAPEDFSQPIVRFWEGITAPTLLCYGTESWNENPETNGRAQHLRNRRTVGIAHAGHWPHHDEFETFIATLRDFLEE